MAIAPIGPVRALTRAFTPRARKTQAVGDETIVTMVRPKAKRSLDDRKMFRGAALATSTPAVQSSLLDLSIRDPRDER